MSAEDESTRLWLYVGYATSQPYEVFDNHRQILRVPSAKSVHASDGSWIMLAAALACQSTINFVL